MVDRGTKMIMEEIGSDDYEYAKSLLLNNGSVRKAVDFFNSINKRG